VSPVSVSPAVLQATSQSDSRTVALSSDVILSTSKYVSEKQKLEDAKERADRLEALVQRLRLAREAADPASLKSDFVMLQDIAIVIVAASFGGMLAAFLLGAENTGIGYVFGGYLVGPSSPFLVLGVVHVDSPYRSTLRRVDAVHTVALLGPIFELFRLGIMYAALRRQRKTNKNQKLASRAISKSENVECLPDNIPLSPQSRKHHFKQLDRRHKKNIESSSDGTLSDVEEGSSKNDGNVSGVCMLQQRFLTEGRHNEFFNEWLAYFLTIFTTAACLSSYVQWTSTIAEGLIFAAAVTLSGTSQVLAALDSVSARHLPSGSAIVRLLTMQDLLLAPCLSVPTALHNALLPSGGSTEGWTMTLAVYVVCTLTAVFLSKGVVPFVLGRIRASSLVSTSITPANLANSSQSESKTTPSASSLAHTREHLVQPKLIAIQKSQADTQASPLVLKQSDKAEPHSPLSPGVNQPGRPFTQRATSAVSGAVPGAVVITPKVRTAARSELLTIVVVGYALGMSLLSAQMSLSYGFGALVAGLCWQSNVTSSNLAKKTLEGATSSAGDGAQQLRRRLQEEQLEATEAVAATLASLFGSVYLASLGMIVSPVFLWQHAGTISCFVAVTFGLKTVGAALTLRFSNGTPWPEALAAGSTLGHVSTVSLFFVGRAQSLGLFSRQLHLLTLSSAFIHMALRPLPRFLLSRTLAGASATGNHCSECADLAGNLCRSFPCPAACLCTQCARQKQVDETL